MPSGYSARALRSAHIKQGSRYDAHRRQNRFPIACKMPQRTSERRIPNLAVTTPPNRTPATIEKNPTVLKLRRSQEA